MAVRHFVTWKLAAEDAATRAADAEGIRTNLESLVGVVPGLRSLEVRANTLYPENNWDIILISELDDAEALAAYQVHPAHLEVVEFVKPRVGDRASIDFEV
ncbi:Dabb family protein [Mycetocola tolaasinivorans]|uniref:Dabb family protein n=1 Tax=Mycetocola tolaasinivorans TaxID=76635 RepID=A0A3L7A5Z9_9MICO|nr:Dabb family protein [Mycetocola tolaasinivorans]RLP75657.1 Dabb family protein [Mycetocola tolaasinivorans]